MEEAELEFSGVREQGKVYNIRHRAYYFGNDVLNFVNSERFKPVFMPVYQQLVKCGTSIGANMVEGNSGVSERDFLNFCRISLKSANETKFWLCQLRDTIGQDKERIRGMLIEADELAKIIAKIIVNTKGKN